MELSDLDPMTGMFRDPSKATATGILPTKKRKYPPLPPAEEKDILDKALNSTVGGLQALGETLDKPGRAVRGLMAGRPSELLNLIPFSDTMGLTDPSKSTSGSDLLQHYGLQDTLTPQQESDQGFMSKLGRGAAGFGAEVLLDPTSYLTLGASAVGKAGKVAKAVGISTKGAAKYKTLGEHLASATPEIVKAAEEAAVKHGSTLADLSGQKLGGLFGTTSGPLGLLGMKPDFMNGVPEIAQGARAQAIGQGIANAPEAITRAIPGIGNPLADLGGAAKIGFKGLFHHPSMGQFTKEGQMAGEFATAGRQKAKAAGELAGIQAADELDNLGKDFHKSFGQQLGTNPQETSKLIRTATQLAAETRHQGKPDVLGALDRLAPTSHNPQLQQKMQAVTEGLVNQQDNIAKSINAKGGDVAMMFENAGASPIGHFGRFIESRSGDVARGKSRMFKTTADMMLQRNDAIRHIPAPVLNQMLTDPSLQGMSKDLIALNLHASYGKDIAVAVKAGEAKAAEMAAAKGIPAVPIDPIAVRHDLADWLKSKQAAGGMGPGAARFIEDAAVNHGKYMTGAHIADANLDAIHQMFNANLDPAGIPLDKAFASAGLKPAEAVNYFGQKFGPEALKNGVTPEAVKAASSFLAKSQKPEWLEKIFDVTDMLTQPLKKNLTLPFPSFLTRNFFSGQAMNLFDPSIGSAKDLNKYRESVVMTKKMLDKPEDYKGLIDEAFAHGAVSRDVQAMGQELGWGFQNQLPNPISMKGAGKNATDAWAEAKAMAFDPMSAVSGIPKSAKNVRAGAATPAALGAKFNQQAEFLNRMPMYVYLRKHLGWTPEAAAQKVRDLQVDYSALSTFERDAMKRMVPFYSYMRRTVPMMLQQLAERPGGTQAQVVRASNTGRSKGEFVPPYIGEGMSVKTGPDTYLSGSGLPTDQYADLFAKGPTALGTIKRTAEKFMSMGNPYVKGPLELATGKNFFTGQDLADSYRHPTGNVILNQAIHNSPISRFVTSERQLTDERKSPLTKAVNLGTGVKITDVSGGLEKQQRIAESKILAEMARDYPQVSAFQDVYVKKDPKTGLPMEIPKSLDDLMRVMQSLKKKAADEAKKKKRLASVPG